jgi:Nuclease-related domain
MSADGGGDDIDLGTAGASARREHERRRANREDRVRAKHPRIGGALLALSDDPTHETVWDRGAGGEEHVAKFLAKYLNDGVVVLHDRCIPRSRANIDHIAVAPSGVWVIDSKRYKGKVAVSKPLFGKAKLTIAGRDKSKLVEGLAKQVALVEAAMPEVAPGVQVRGALCFVDADLPMLGKLSFNGYPLLYPRPLAKRINGDGPLAGKRVRGVAAELARRFPAA